MYEDNKKHNLNIDWKSLTIKMIILLVALFIIIWLISLVNGKKTTKLESNLKTNLNMMSTTANDYFVGSNLPEYINSKKKLNLGEMFDSKLMVEFTDEQGKSCDLENSYIEATKLSDTDYNIKARLICGDKTDYIVKTVTRESIEKDSDNALDNNITNNDDNIDNIAITTPEEPDNKVNNVVSNNNVPTTNTNTNVNKITNTNTNTTTNVTTNNTKPACTYGNLENTSKYPLAYQIPGNCAAIASDYYKANYANTVSDIASNEYVKLTREIANISSVNRLYVEQPIISGVYNYQNGLVGYQIRLKALEKSTYNTRVIYEYYLDQNGNRKIIIDNRNSISKIEDITSISLKTTNVTLNIGDTYTINATINPSNASSKNIIWTSSNTNVASVKNNIITALKKGSATITGTLGNKTIKLYVTVKENNYLNVDAKNYYLKENENAQIYLDTNISNITYYSSDKSVATVSSTGLITTRKKGYTTITIRGNDITKVIAIYVK